MKIIQYFEDTYTELVEKVTWPSWSELQNSAIVVMVASLVISLVVFVMDFSFRNLLQFIYKLFY